MKKRTKEENEAIEIFTQFEEETKTRFINTDHKNLDFTKAVLKFIDPSAA